MRVKNALANLIPFFCILAVWLIFSYPYFLKGKMPYSSTYQVNNFAPWDAYPEFAGPVKNGAMPDVTTQIFPWKHFTIQTLKKGEIPLWNPYSFSGTPHLANYQSAVLSPFNLLFFIFPFRDAWSLLVLIQPLLAGIFMYIFIRSLFLSKSAGLFSAISFMFCGFITVWMDYGTLSYAILFLPLALFAIEKYSEFQNILYLFLLSLTVPLSFFSGHFQISLYFLVSVAAYLIYKIFQIKDIYLGIIMFFFLVAGLLFSMPQILPSLEFYSQSLRSSLFQIGEVIPWLYIPTFIAPDFFGNPVTRNDWFGHYAEWNAYIGFLPFALAFYSLKRREFKTYVFFAFGLIAFLLAFPTPLLGFIIAFHIPVLATSAASRIIVIYSFFFILLSAFGFDELIKDINKDNKKPLIIWAGCFFLIFFLLWIIIFTKKLIPIEKIVVAKQNLILPTSIFLVSSLVILMNIFLRNLRKTIIIFLILIVAVDMLRFATKWQPFDTKSLAFTDVAITNFFPKISDYKRVIGNFGAETSVYYNLSSLEGYDALYINRYGEFIAFLRDGKYNSPERSVVTFPKDGFYTSKAINLLNVAYIVHKISDDYTAWTFPYWKYPASQFKKIYDDGKYRVYKNNMVFPRAFFVDSYSVATNPKDILSKMFSQNFDLRHKIILEKNPGIAFYTSSDNNFANINSYSPDNILISTASKNERLLFLSDPYYPGWKATIDGKSTDILRADYSFRAIKVPAGKHIVRFTYFPFSFTLGIYLSIAGLVAILFFIFFPRTSKI